MRSSKRSKTRTKFRVTAPFTASLLSASLSGGIAAILIRFFGQDPKSVLVVAIFASVIASCILMNEDQGN